MFYSESRGAWRSAVGATQGARMFGLVSGAGPVGVGACSKDKDNLSRALSLIGSFKIMLKKSK